jgi:hypothetical protein
METIDKWHHTKQGNFTFGLAELLIAYGFASWAIDSGQLWQYALAVIFFYGGVRNLVQIFRTNHNGHKRNQAKAAR